MTEATFINVQLIGWTSWVTANPCSLRTWYYLCFRSATCTLQCKNLSLRWVPSWSPFTAAGSRQCGRFHPMCPRLSFKVWPISLFPSRTDSGWYRWPYSFKLATWSPWCISFPFMRRRFWHFRQGDFRKLFFPVSLCFVSPWVYGWIGWRSLWRI